MSKYIDAEKLIAEIERRLKNIRDYINGAGMKYKGPKFYKARGTESAYDALLSIITSLQQEQPECIYGRSLEEREKYCRICSAVCKARVQQEQQEVDLEKEIIRYQREDMDRDTTVGDVAHHFYKLGLNARKK